MFILGLVVVNKSSTDTPIRVTNIVIVVIVEKFVFVALLKSRRLNTQA